MKCPYCENEMFRGIIQGDGRQPFKWVEDGEKIGFMDRMFSDEKHIIAERHPFGKTTLEGYKCKICQKIIIDI